MTRTGPSGSRATIHGATPGAGPMRPATWSGSAERAGAATQLTDDDADHTITARVCYKADGSIRVYDCRDFSHSQPVRGPLTVPSDWDRVPSGLEAGDQFRLLMVSKGKRTARETDIAVYNTWAQGPGDRRPRGHPGICGQLRRGG